MSQQIHIAPVAWLSAEQTAAWHAVVSAAVERDLPGRPSPSPEQVHAQLTTAGLDSRRLFWLAAETDGSIVGVAALRLFDSAGQGHLAELELHVHPDARRRGAGTQLLSAAAFAARVEQRRSLLTLATDGTAGDAFCTSRAFRRVLTLHQLLLPVAEADDSAADTEHPGYELVGWTGPVPDHLAAPFAEAKNAMNDMPTGEMDYGHVSWDADRVRKMAQVLADRGDTLLTLAALKGDTMGGFTEVVIRAGETRRALQYDTAVVPAHRGHGLGLWLKASMTRTLKDTRPGIVEIETDNADDNTHMLAVNRRLGFRPQQIVHEYQLDLPDA
ncbi:GNAT family N-acetyltransferase [Streptomyces sp. TLI_105]|uniref:GNAT family N-acetyltransferase n=1 Tax=Streptomyces sp. TLI_105 TaxID=1881019 RepID=UPI00089C2BD1|nr:GNAT family N-acetyltransferase [Streptomyces sp. TLI_105]SEE20719.1 L-amino acid N-acyltransferase YncA [Streptomyces sp. TLI_105]